MSFIPFEDVPLYLGFDGQDGEFIFAESASLSVSQPMGQSRQIDDDILRIMSHTNPAQTFFLESQFLADTPFSVTLGPIGGPPQPLATSIERIPQDTKITFPGNKEFFFLDEIEPNGFNYRVNLYCEEDTTLNFDEAQSGRFQPIFKYHNNGPTVGKLDVDFYFNESNLQPFFNLIDNIDDEKKITGFLGNFRFNDAYLNTVGFSLGPNSISQARASFDLYGLLVQDSTIIDSYFDRDLYRQQSIPHGQNSNIVGLADLGVNHAIDFSYSINVERNARFGLPSNDNYLAAQYGNFLVPDRVTKQRTTIQMSVEGDSLNPDLLEDGFNGKRANLTVNLHDLNYEDFGSEPCPTFLMQSLFQADGSSNFLDTSSYSNNVTVGANASHRTLVGPPGDGFQDPPNQSSIIFIDGANSRLDRLNGIMVEDIAYYNKNLTVDFWVFIGETPTADGEHFILHHGDQNMSFLLRGPTHPDGPGLYFNIEQTDRDPVDILIRDLNALTLDTWFHVAVTKKNDTFSTYFNGSQVSSQIANVQFPSTSNLIIGQSQELFATTRTTFMGALQDIRISNEALYDDDFDLPVTYNDPELDCSFDSENQKGFLRSFSCNGIIDQQNLSVTSAGYLIGSISVREVHQ